jgi:hypothetical protein
VIEDANPQSLSSPWQEKIEEPELLSIKGAASCVKAGAGFADFQAAHCSFADGRFQIRTKAARPLPSLWT